MRDNKTSQPAEEYDGNIGKTMPFYDDFHNAAISLIEVVQPYPSSWLDTGCGTGTLVADAARKFSGTYFTLADPSAAMLDIAREKTGEIPRCRYLALGTETLDCPNETYDVITAMLAHHYFDVGTRRIATANCYRMLKPGGVYVTFETVLPATEYGRRTGLEWWRRAQIRQGKSAEIAEKHIKRYNVEFFPIMLSSHLELLRDTGFSAVEVLWVSGMQAGFYAVK